MALSMTIAPIRLGMYSSQYDSKPGFMEFTNIVQLFYALLL